MHEVFAFNGAFRQFNRLKVVACVDSPSRDAAESMPDLHFTADAQLNSHLGVQGLMFRAWLLSRRALFQLRVCQGGRHMDGFDVYAVGVGDSRSKALS